MTFEEFFQKKKIDLVKLAEYEPALFIEFRLHYGLMGPKSFDHTKKYWFNELRRRFPVPKEEKIIPAIVKTETIITTAVEAAPVVTTAKPGFKPLFKRPLPPKPEGDQTPEIAPETSNTPAYKPRFNPAMGAKKAEEQTAEKITSEIIPEKPEELKDTSEKEKPAYKPRFNPAMAKKTVSEPPASDQLSPEVPVNEPHEEQQGAQPHENNQKEAPLTRPAYKPKFRPPSTPKSE